MSRNDADTTTAGSKERPSARAGLLHVIDAMGYSMAGLRRLFQETAARLELGAIALGCVLLGLVGADLSEWAVFAVLAIVVLIVEALNTALEVLTDRISPEWSIEAKHAKDLGSAAVALALLVAGGWVVKVCLGAWLGS